MDTKKLESIAVNLITHNLLSFDLLIARPEFDTRAADLLVFKSMEDNAKMGRIQC